MYKQFSDTVKILRMIGSPFDKNGHENIFENNKNKILELYSIAKKNKIGLAFLEHIKDEDKLKELDLELVYQNERKMKDDQLNTMNRISKLLNSSNVNYTIFKSLMPFPAITNDIDIIHFGSEKDYKKIIELLLRSDYMEVKGDMDAEQCTFHDTIYGKRLEPHSKKKDVYDIDIYQKIAASHLIYIDKRKFKNEVYIYDNNIRLLRPEAELAIIIVHSIVPEMLCTLFLYYAILSHISKMNKEEINRFIYLAKYNNITFSVKIVCSIVAELHRISHGFVPDKIEQILEALGRNKREKNILIKNNFKMPHRYSSITVIRTLFEKTKESTFRKSIFEQVVYMSNPKFLIWFISEVLWRRKRETY